MPPTTRNKSGAASRRSGSSGRKASSKKRLDKENAELKRKLAQYEAAEEARKTAKKPTKEPSTAKKPPKDPKIPSNLGAKPLTKDQVTKDEMAAIQKAINHHTFCATIFLPVAGNPIWNKVMQKIYLSLDPPPSPESKDMNEWITTRANVCGSAYNYTRTYISGQLKKSVYEYARANGGCFPSLLKIQSIADRTIKLFLSDDEEVDPVAKAQVQENIDHFKWYWDVLLGRCCPSGTKFWESNTKYYTLISDKKSPITPQMEAFIVVNFLNNYQYWHLRYNLELIHPKIPIQKKPKMYVVPPLKEGETNKGWSMATVIRKKGNKAEKVIYYQTDEWDTKYSKSDAGSSVSGGWTKEGKLLFINWVERVREARNRRGTRAMEDLIWTALRTDYSIQADNPEVENLVTRRSVARESEADIDWDAAIGFNLFGGSNEANDSANPAGNEVEKSDNPSADEHQEEDSDHNGSSEENEHTFQI
jgi:hypothetical protein